MHRVTNRRIAGNALPDRVSHSGIPPQTIARHLAANYRRFPTRWRATSGVIEGVVRTLRAKNPRATPIDFHRQAWDALHAFRTANNVSNIGEWENKPGRTVEDVIIALNNVVALYTDVAMASVMNERSVVDYLAAARDVSRSYQHRRAS